MLIKVTQKCLVSYIEEEDKDKASEKGVVSFRSWYYDSDKNNFLDAINEIVNDFDVDRASGENEETEYCGELIETLDLVGFEICQEDIK